ncbi:hypothetical protein VCRA2114E365_60048 [Vibrio crassostreae]|nr:hypothetical protein VCRA2112O187_30044 [Vibrio crassostreae]CAK2167004.1 hypothetical protein VCRA2113O357_60048 [Vibrio crassostreae]CAK2172822.1 hypothetical protein VCRA2114O367_60049 [Vibrio crassostreae]CAK2185237.1 hypothetical protein VCRA2113O362_60182 [Vibrio crassostreae]CAK2189410.1 hypothetical protein VCRA2113O354_60181 [Vibrio crassostreae]
MIVRDTTLHSQYQTQQKRCLHPVILIRKHYPQIVFIINLVEWF